MSKQKKRKLVTIKPVKTKKIPVRVGLKLKNGKTVYFPGTKIVAVKKKVKSKKKLLCAGCLEYRQIDLFKMADGIQISNLCAECRERIERETNGLLKKSH